MRGRRHVNKTLKNRMTTFIQTINALIKIEQNFERETQMEIFTDDWYSGNRDNYLTEMGLATKDRFIQMREDLKCCDDLTETMVKFGDADKARRDREYHSFVKNEGYRLGGCRWIGKGKGISFPPHIWRFILGYALQDFKLSLNGEVPQKGKYRPFSLTKRYKISPTYSQTNVAGVRVMPSWTFAGYCNNDKKNVWFIKRETNHATPVLYEDFPRQKVALQNEFPYQPEFALEDMEEHLRRLEFDERRGETDHAIMRLGNWLVGQQSDRGTSRYGQQNMFWYNSWRKGKIPTKAGKVLTDREYSWRNDIRNNDYFDIEPARVLYLEFAEGRLKCFEKNYTTFHIKRDGKKLTNKIREYFEVCFQSVFNEQGRTRNGNENEESEKLNLEVKPLLIKLVKMEKSIVKRKDFYLGKGGGTGYRAVYEKRGKTEMIKIPKNQRSKTAQYFCGHNIAAYGDHQDMD